MKRTDPSKTSFTEAIPQKCDIQEIVIKSAKAKKKEHDLHKGEKDKQS